MPFELLSERRRRWPTLREILQETERQALIERILVCDGDQKQARQSLGLTKATFYRHLEAHQLTPQYRGFWRELTRGLNWVRLLGTFPPAGGKASASRQTND